MKEIKFRVWDKEDKKMIYSGIIDNREFKGELYLSLSGEISIFVDEDGGKEGLWEHEIEYDKDRFVLMEYTGAIDNNRKEIYEGDILKSEIEQKYQEKKGLYHIHRVFFNEAELRFEAEPFLPITWGGYKKREIIGNIYENPELLEEEK
ncbi:MAG: YopX family protein [Methanofastidiosum sp.]|jgi:uncharacterized phage protein (TIGR01671 family)